MSSFTVVSKTSLRPDPDDASPEVAGLNVGDTVARLHELANWSKVSFTDKSGREFLGWLHSDTLREIKPRQINLYDEPFGQAKQVTGDLFQVKIDLAPWRKVEVRLEDGSVLEGWIEDGDAATGGATPAGGGQPPELPAPSDEEDLSLGPNETYRPYLLEAERLTGIDAAAIAAIIDAEASKLGNGQWNSNSRAGGSSAAGLTQFLDDTWLAQAARKGTQLNLVCKAKGDVSDINEIVPGRQADLLALRFDPRLSILSAAEYGLFNCNAMIKDGLVDDQIGDDEKAQYIYLAHHEGLAGAEKYLRRSDTHTFSDLSKQVGAREAQTLVDAASGDTTAAYRTWLKEYIDQHIQPAKFRKQATGAPSGTGAAALSQFDGPPIALDELGGDPQLVKGIQWRLFELGYLDPPADGAFGPVSHWALSEFCDRNGVSLDKGFSRSAAQALLSPSRPLPDVATTGTWFDKVIVYMKNNHYFICRHPDCKNIIYLEGVNLDGTLNDNAPNVFNDLRIVFVIDKNGAPNFKDSIWDATTTPGTYWTTHPMNPRGAAIIALNQYKSWVVGTHHPGTPQAHEALVQAAPVTVFRDSKMDFKREGPTETGIFAINQHWGYNEPRGDLGRSSAGCLVGRTTDGHRQFMSLVKNDPRYEVNHSYKFVTAVMPGVKVLA